MKWTQNEKSFRVPIKSWCEDLENNAMTQAVNLAKHPAVWGHVALMPDCHSGYGMPIGGVIGCHEAVIPNAVGVDIGCGMGAIKTTIPVDKILGDKPKIRTLLEDVKKHVPIGEGHSHKHPQKWDHFEHYLDSIDHKPGWLDNNAWKLAQLNLGSLGGGNHFIELQKGDDGFIYLMLHSGSRNLGYRIANFYHNLAIEYDKNNNLEIPVKDLAYLPVDSKEGQLYIRDMTFALEYAQENRRRMMNVFKKAAAKHLPGIEFVEETNIHHNYANLEDYQNKQLWIHRKGATSAKEGERGIIPGSMGTPSYLVEGLGNTDSFQSCSHGAGRKMSRMEASRRLSLEECNDAMGNVVFDRWSKMRGRGRKNSKLYDFGESPLAYKNIDKVIESELDLIKPITRLKPLGVIKG